MKERCLRKIFSISLHCCLWNGKLNAGTSFQSSFGCSFKIALPAIPMPTHHWVTAKVNIGRDCKCCPMSLPVCHVNYIYVIIWVSRFVKKCHEWFDLKRNHFSNSKNEMERKWAKTTNLLKFTSGGLWKDPLVSKCRFLQLWCQNFDSKTAKI